MDRIKAYSVLGIPENATEEDIKTAYRNLAHKYNVDNYEAGPLKDEAEQKMNEINEAFDVLMSYLRAGTVPNNNIDPVTSSNNNVGRYPAIRLLINSGRADEALAELQAIPYGSSDAEWNFLMGSAYYYKGWLDQALQYFKVAVSLDPGNREYEAALRNLSGSSDGNMQGNPFMGNNPDAAAINCACNTCTLMCCMDACCGMCRGI